MPFSLKRYAAGRIKDSRKSESGPNERLLLKLLPERRQFLIVPLMPPIFLGVHTAGSFFAYLTVGTTTNSTATFFGTLATDLLCCGFFWLYSLVVCTPMSGDIGAGIHHLSRSGGQDAWIGSGE